MKAKLIAASIALAAFVMCIGNVNAQSSPIGRDGELTRMPFDPDVPVTRTETQRTANGTLFVTHTSMDYDSVVEHYQEIYVENWELAPGWTLLGYGFDHGLDAMSFSLNYSDRMFRLFIRPERGGSGAILYVTGTSLPLQYDPYMDSLAPVMPSDMQPVHHVQAR
ncbi:MAG: hypothetical protein KC561_09600 [Myxococcales bacterium]|nr:hypothetical protein [Myxococcales bacterium]